MAPVFIWISMVDPSNSFRVKSIIDKLGKMTPEQIIKELERYRFELTGIMERYIHGHNSLRIKREDDPRYRTFIIEIIDLLNDALDKNKYSQLINNAFMQGTYNELQTPSYKSIEDIVSIIDSAITRLKRNPDFHIKKEEPMKLDEPMKTDLKPPDKMTLKWIWEHTPPSYYWKVLVFLFAIFCLGITFASTNLYKSLIEPAIPNKNNAIQNIRSSAVKK